MSHIVLIVGYQASGKSTLSQTLINQGYTHINRDKEGGSIAGLVPLVEAAIKGGKNVVLDNTFPTKAGRKMFIDLARKHKASITCYWLNTSIEDAQFNACTRLIKMFDSLPSNNDIKKSKHPNVFPPAALFGYRKEFEKPTTQEGFDKVEVIEFTRVIDPTYDKKALLLDFDGTLRDTKSGAKFPTDPKDIFILPGRKEILQAKKKEGYILLGVSNQSGIEKGDLTMEQAKACFDKTIELLGVDIDVSFCPHRVPPISCYCRKPMPGMGVAFIEKYKLDASKCVVVGDMKTDQTFADRCGFKFADADVFFGSRLSPQNS